MVRHARYRIGIMNVGGNDPQTARVDAIQPKHREDRGECSCRTPARRREHLNDAKLFLKGAVGLAPPVVEVAGNDKGRFGRHGFPDTLRQGMYLPSPPALEQSEMDIDAMQRRK